MSRITFLAILLSMTKSKAEDITPKVIEGVNEVAPADTLIVPEFFMGSVIADVGVFTPTTSVGIEIKSAADSLRRLPRQIQGYDAIFPENILVVADEHARAAINMLPETWGVVVVNADVTAFNVVRRPQSTPTSTLSVASTLWDSELKTILREHSALRGWASATRAKKAERMVDVLGPDVDGVVIAAIRERFRNPVPGMIPREYKHPVWTGPVRVGAGEIESGGPGPRIS